MRLNNANSTLIKKHSITTDFVVTNSVVRNTYALLALTLLFSAATAYLAVVTNAPALGLGPLLLLNFGLVYLIHSFKNSAWGVLAIFTFTGAFGYTLGPVINFTLHNYVNGASILVTTLGLTGIIFLSLSCYAMTVKQNFNYLVGFLLVGATTILAGILLNMFFQFPMLDLLLLAGIVLLASGWILYHTSEIINGGETNYIIATLSLYVQIYNLFISLLRILTIFAGKRE